MMETLLQDIRYGLRMMRRSPGFSAVAILTLALGIGANTAIFSLVNAVLLHSLPYPKPDQLVKVSFNNPGIGLSDVTFSYPEFDDLRTKANVFDEVCVVWPSSGNLTGAQTPERLELLAVSPNYFTMLGAVAERGRLFGAQDNSFAGFEQVAVISDGLWRRSYGASPSAIGRSLQIDNDPYTIIGVLSPQFRHPGRTVTTDVEVWLTAGFRGDPFSPGRKERELPGAMGRLRAGLTVKQAAAKLGSFSHAVRSDYPDDYPSHAGWEVAIQPLQESLVGDVRPMLWTLMGAVMAIVLIASSNIANLLLARASGRQREMAVRLAVGAKPRRVISQLLTESLILALIGGVLGVATAAVTLGFLLRLVPAKIPRLTEVHIDWTVLLFALAISLLTGLLFGLVPALQLAKPNLFSAIREGSGGAGYSSKTSRMRGILIVSELAIAVVLMVGAGLLLRTFWGLLHENPGFNPGQVVSANFWLPVPNDPKADKYEGVVKQTTFLRDVLSRIKAIPGIQSAAITSALPVTASKMDTTPIAIEGRPVVASDDLSAEVIRVTPEYLKVMQAALVRGRFFEEHDETGKQAVAIVDQSTAKRYWPNEDPVDRRHVLVGSARHPMAMTIIGIIKDIKHDGLDKDGFPHLYASAYQRSGRILSVVARTTLSAQALEPQIRSAIQTVDPGLPVFNVRSMNDIVDDSLASRRFSAELVAAFALLALVLASIGTYGLLAYTTRQRVREIGIRMALGARQGDILTMFMQRGFLLSGTGLVIGLIVALFAARGLASLLYGVHPVDIGVFVTVPLLLLPVCLIASYIPARRAAKIDPMLALRQE